MSGSIEGFWILYVGDIHQKEFIPGQSSSGVLILETGRLFGGDSAFYWSGHYEVNGDRITGVATSKHYNGSNMTVFGVDIKRADVSLTAIRTGDKMIYGEIRATAFDGYPAPEGAPSRPAWLIKVEELP